MADTLQDVRVLDRVSGDVERWPAAACGFGYRRSRFKEDPDRHVVLDVRFRLVPGPPRLPLATASLPRPWVTTLPPPHSCVRPSCGSVAASRWCWILATPTPRTAGSFFLNPVVPAAQADAIATLACERGWIDAPAGLPRYPAEGGQQKLAAAWLIERAGFPKGTRAGAVGQSSNHALALVHHGGGSTTALLAHATAIQQAVERCFGVRLAREPTCW